MADGKTKLLTTTGRVGGMEAGRKHDRLSENVAERLSAHRGRVQSRQRPLNTGVRFSRNAACASAASSVLPISDVMSCSKR